MVVAGASLVVKILFSSVDEFCRSLENRAVKEAVDKDDKSIPLPSGHFGSVLTI